MITTDGPRHHELTIRMPVVTLNGSGNVVARVAVRLAKPVAEPQDLLSAIGSEVAGELQGWFASRTCDEVFRQVEDAHRDIRLAKTHHAVLAAEVSAVRALVLLQSAAPTPLLPEAEDTQDSAPNTPTPPTLVPEPKRPLQPWRVAAGLLALAAAVALGYTAGITWGAP